MKNKLRLCVYSALALPFIAMGFFAASLQPLERASFFGDFKRNTTRLLSGEWDLSEIVRPQRGGDRRANQWQGGRSFDVDPVLVFARLDLDDDGKLAGDELGERFRTSLDPIDTDKDGALTLEEFQQGMRAAWLPNPVTNRHNTGPSRTRPAAASWNGSSDLDQAVVLSLHADKLFDPNHVVEVEVDIPEQDWQALCAQSRNFQTAVENPLAKPYTYFKGDITIDGVPIRQVGIRKKGFIGSQDSIRPSLKIKFDEFVEQEPVRGLDRLTLNNNKQDTSLLSQFLTYRLFNEAGVAAPRCSYATVTVNGRYLGIYSNVESIRKPFLQESFGDDSGNLYEGTLTDFYPKSIEWFEPKTNEKQDDRTLLLDLARLLDSGDSPSLDAINELVDVDNFLKYWAIESLISFWDGYTQNQNNFFVYDHPQNGKLYFVPWGADSCFASRPRFMRSSENSSAAVRAVSILAHRLYHTNDVPERYRSVLIEILTSVWDEQRLLKETDRIEQLLFDHLDFHQVGSILAMEQLRDFIRQRHGRIMAELEDGWPVEVREEPRKPMYTVEVGAAKGTFSIDGRSDNVEVHDGQPSVSMILDGESVSLKSITITGMQDDRPLTLNLTLDDEAFQGGLGKKRKVTGTFVGGEAVLGFSRQSRSVRGEIKLTQLGNEQGKPISGEFDVKILETRGGFMDRRRR